ncbi:hypothetical protein J6590_075057 [Homalodisca vitripennis]|nr:hypothetical protein J6590_075057 [Homalodisca vitripennis]
MFYVTGQLAVYIRAASFIRHTVHDIAEDTPLAYVHPDTVTYSSSVINDLKISGNYLYIVYREVQVPYYYVIQSENGMVYPYSLHDVQ